MNRLKLFTKMRKIVVVSICLLITLMISLSPTTPFKTSDALGSLITAESILNHGTIKLDAYRGELEFYTWQIEEKNGHLYYVFPKGNSFIALPFVAISKFFRMRMTKFEDEIKLQRGMSALTVTLSFILLLLIATRYLSFRLSLLVSCIFLFGTSLMSTMGAAYWSHNTAVVFILLCLLYIANYETGKTDQINPYLLGLLLFSSFLCRPTAAIFIGSVFVYIWISYRHIFLKLAITSTLLFLVFTGLSLLEYRQVLPDYYLPNRMGDTNVLSNLYGCLLSPSRGVLVYSPFLMILPLFAFLLVYRNLSKSKRSISWILFSWFLVHLFVIGSFSHWWGGGGFGPRLFTDAIPAFFVITVLIWSDAQKLLSSMKQKLILMTFIILAMPAVYFNSYTGLFNESVPAWNDDAFYDRFPEYLNDWRFPPFLASPTLMAKRDSDLKQKYPPLLFIEDTVLNEDGGLVSNPYEALDRFGTNVWRLLRGIYVETTFRVDLSETTDVEKIELSVVLKKNSYKRIRVFLNGRRIGVLPRGIHPHLTYSFPVKRHHLKRINTLRMTSPAPKRDDAASPIIDVNIRSYKLVNIGAGHHNREVNEP